MQQSEKPATGRFAQLPNVPRLPLLLAVLFLALMALPQTGWIVRTQLGPVNGPSATYAGELETEAPTPEHWSPPGMAPVLRLEQEAAHHPQDYDLQLVAAIGDLNPSSDECSARLRAILPRFSNHAALYAHILRMQLLGQVHLVRDEDWGPDEIAELVEESYRMTAPKRLVSLLDRE